MRIRTDRTTGQNSESYLQQIFYQVFERLTDEERRQALFQQNSATAHTARASEDALREVFGGSMVLQTMVSYHITTKPHNLKMEVAWSSERWYLTT
jgi:hypothetical protein